MLVLLLLVAITTIRTDIHIPIMGHQYGTARFYSLQRNGLGRSSSCTLLPKEKRYLSSHQLNSTRIQTQTRTQTKRILSGASALPFPSQIENEK